MDFEREAKLILGSYAASYSDTDVKNLTEQLRYLNAQTVKEICERLDRWGGHGYLYALEIRKDYNIK